MALAFTETWFDSRHTDILTLAIGSIESHSSSRTGECCMGPSCGTGYWNPLPSPSCERRVEKRGSATSVSKTQRRDLGGILSRALGLQHVQTMATLDFFRSSTLTPVHAGRRRSSDLFRTALGTGACWVGRYYWEAPDTPGVSASLILVFSLLSSLWLLLLLLLAAVVVVVVVGGGAAAAVLAVVGAAVAVVRIKPGTSRSRAFRGDCIRLNANASVRR